MTASTQVNPRAGGSTAWLELLSALSEAPLPETPALSRHIEACRIRRGGTLFGQGEAHPFLYVVRQGLFKLVYLSEDGTEWVKSFAEEGRFFASFSALQPSGRTSFMACALEDSVAERLDFHIIEDLSRTHLAWSRVVVSMLSTFAARKEWRERELLTLTPEARYRSFVQAFPELARRIPQKDLARFLGVTAVGLSRIAVRLRQPGAGGPRRATSS